MNLHCSFPRLALLLLPPALAACGGELFPTNAEATDGEPVASASLAVAGGTVPPLPPTPSLTPNVEGELNTNLITALTTGADMPRTTVHPALASVDQRLRVDSCDQVCPPGATSCSNPGPTGGVCFFTVNPEVFVLPYDQQYKRDVSTPMPYAAAKLHGSHLKSAVATRGSRAICDSFPDRPQGAVRFDVGTYNPSRCSSNANEDCYDITLLSRVEGKDLATDVVMSELWAAQLRVHVTNPKTATAFVSNIEPLGDPVQSGLGPQTVTSFFTPAVSGDGRLIVFKDDTEGLVYSIIPTTKSPCDVTGVTQMTRLAAMPGDPAANGNYGLARQPLRDTDGQLIPPTKTFDSGGYLWMDLNGSNLMYNLDKAEPAFFYNSLLHRVETRVPISQMMDSGVDSFPELQTLASPSFNCATSLAYPCSTMPTESPTSIRST